VSAPNPAGEGPLVTLGPDEKARKREKIIDTLWALQEKRGWISDEDVRAAGAECGMTPAEVDEVATFYNLLLRRPAGKMKVFVCDSISCEIRGSDRLMERMSAALGIKPGETTPDGMITLLPIVCLGHCERAPCLLAGREIHGPLEDDGAVNQLVQRIKKDAGSPPQG
jgi:NADH-quinone oxidoreductase subunit E